MEQHSMQAASLFQFMLFFSFLAAAISLPRGEAAGGGSEADGDRLALLAFKSELSGDTSGVLSSWNATLDLCQWPGVTCGASSGKRLQRVTTLDLDSFGLSGIISPSLANLTYLQSLRLPNNQLHGPIPAELASLPGLLHLNLSYNNLIDGPIPASICGPSGGLQTLDLRQNSLLGEIPSNFSRCSAIQILHLDDNMLFGNIPDFLGNLSALSWLRLSYNNFVGVIPASLGGLPSLSSIDLSANRLVGEVPPSLYNMSNIYQLGWDRNNLTGALPDDLFRTLPQLEILLLYENNFYGAIPSSISNASSLSMAGIDNNGFTGRVPGNLGALGQLQVLTIDHNRLGGSTESEDLEFITELTNCSNLRILAAHNNRLQGKLPSSIANLSFTSLQAITLGQNNISGVIPPGIGDLTQLTIFVVEQNIIGGSIPETIGKMKNLGMLSLAANMLVGEIPSSIGNLSRLTSLTLAANQLTGRIPESIGRCRNLERLYLRVNRLTGGIPIGIFSIPTLSIEASFAHNFLSGTLPAEVGEMANLGTFDISFNNFSGDIPGVLADNQHLQQLYMQNNSFGGTIPLAFKNFKSIQVLDLSANNLSGSIPAFLEQLNLISLNLSFNHFSGEVPEGGIFLNASAISLHGNDQLCGGSPVFNLPPCHKHTNTTIIIAVAIAVIGALFLISLLIFVLHRISRKRSEKGQRVQVLEDQQLIRVSYDALSKATDGFSPENLIGAGGFGSVYKGVIADDDQGNPREVAVKVFDLKRVGATHSFVAECEALRSVRHRNLVRIITACSSIDSQGNDFKALVFEFLPNGNLDRWLHASGEEEGSKGSSRKRLSHVQRLDIAVDIATAMKYLHQDGPSPIIHCDLKPSNVLLDDDMAAHVGDFGLARFIHTSTDSTSSSAQNSETTSSGLLRGSIGYVAPEYGMGSKASTQGDVYSFGILLLEMLTGKRPTDEAFKDGLSLHNFVRTACCNELVMGIIDPILDISDGHQEDGKTDCSAKEALDCVRSLLTIALCCSNESPADRMQIGDVVHQLIKNQCSGRTP